MPIKPFARKHFYIDSKKGFTLIEILVSVAIFTIVMTIAIGALLTINASLQKAKLLRTAIESMNITLEGIAKKIRTGKDYYCIANWETGGTINASVKKDCPASGTINGYGIAFYSFERQAWIAYRVTPQGAIEYASSPDAIIEWKNSSGESYDVITPPDLKINRLRFYVSGQDSGDAIQPKVIITVSGVASLPGKKSLDTTFNLQTVASQRAFDN